MNSVNFENQILDAIETVVNNAVQKAGYDKTIKAVIIERLDQNTGKYKAKYQDGNIEVYSNNIDIFYPNGTLVNILVPNGDFSQNKTIIDAVEKGKIEYAVAVEEEEEYQNESGNAIAAAQMFGLCSYKETDKKVLYNRDAGINDINLDTLSFVEYIKNSDSIICGAEFRTELDEIQKSKGNFGIVFDLDFKDNKTGDIITKSYKIDVNQMSGNPYNLNISTRQYKVFSINGENFDSINQIYIFSENFPNQSGSITRNDIYVGAFELSAANKISEEDMNGYSLNLTKQGKGYFDASDNDDSTINLVAELKIKNKIVANDISYYWFKENTSVAIGDAEYLRYGGEGWECLNNYNVVNAVDGIRLYISNTDPLIVKKSDVTTAELRIKCVAIKDGNIIAEKIGSIINYDNAYNLTIESDGGNQFYFDNGNPNLICKINNIIDTSNDFSYQWGYVDNNGNYSLLTETTEDNEIYNAAAEGYALLKSQIETGKAMAAASQEQLNEYLTTLENYSTIQRVEGNTIFNTDISQIYEKGIFKCTVSKNGIFIGTAAITLYNTLSIEGDYHLEIVNGTQTFSYNGMGVSPASKTLEKPIQIEPLSFTIVDNLGKPLNSTILEHCEIEWSVPTTDTMLIAEDSKNLTLNYSIAEKYDSAKLNNNTIKLSVKYKTLVLNAETAFTFVKEGEPGTNGTEIICKIVPNTDSNIDDYPMIFNGNLNYTPKTTGKWFKIQLWQSGKLLWSGTDTDSRTGVTVAWSILKNQFNASHADVSNISVSSEGIFSYNNNYQSYGADIIKGAVTYRGKQYYCTIPMIVGYSNSSYGNYKIKLVKDTGFRYVMYANDGTNPQYDNTRPFTIQVLRKINGYWEDVSIATNNYRLTYSWTSIGRIYQSGWTNISPLIDGTKEANTKYYIPRDKFDGECVNVAIEVQILDKDNHTIGYIHIPIHFYLDRYGIAALNEWDGNKITLDNELGAILAPQVGAGKKNANNQFTGVLMGTMKDQNSTVAKQGLFGLHEGVRTIFLDADTGKAEFGKAGSSQIIIDPASSKAQLYSGNYSTTEKTGMLIDLTTPEIRFGSGKFVVNSNGQITATDVDLTGAIKATSGTFGNGSSKITIGTDGNNSAIYSGNKSTLTAAHSGFYIGTNGIALGSYDSTNGNPFQVTTAGVLTARGATISGTMTATSGKIGNWSISSGAIKYSDTVYLGSDGAVKFGKFSVDTSGNMTATSATISGTVTATAGTIGGCSITDGSLKVDSSHITSLNADVINAGSLSADRISGGTINGNNINVINLSASSITGGTMSANRISGGTLNVGANGGYLTVGVGYTHPEVSGLNITGSGGIDMGNSGISDIYSLSIHGGYTGKTKTLSFYSGLTISSSGNITKAWKTSFDVRCGIITYIADAEQVYP